jgi:hypothetical protein
MDMVHRKRHIVFRVVVYLLLTSVTLAGPPFITDDPQPVEYGHWELYFSSMQFFSSKEIDATLPHVEINYGVFPDVQFHVILPMGFVYADGNSNYGFSNTEIGIKYRFIDETDDWPQVGMFPMVEVPTASNEQNLGSGKPQLFLPLWVQKSWGDFTTYGGGGFWYNPGEENKNYLLLGWELQYNFSAMVMLGTEFTFQTADVVDGSSDVMWNLGGMINFDSTNHLLFSIGHTIDGAGSFIGYIGYQLTM